MCNYRDYNIKIMLIKGYIYIINRIPNILIQPRIKIYSMVDMKIV